MTFTYNPIAIFNASDVEPEGYELRKTAKAVVIDGNGNSLVFRSSLIGGWVEEGESWEEALHREAMEEVGAEIEIIKSLGEVVAYRDALKRKYVVCGFLCRYVRKTDEPLLLDPDELQQPASWEKIEDTIARIESDIEELKKQSPDSFEGDTYQAKLYNRMSMLIFLKESLLG